MTAFCSGFGQYHSDNHKTNPQPYCTTDFNKIKSLVKNPPSVDKATAQWIIFSSLLSREVIKQRAQGNYLAIWCDFDNHTELDQIKHVLACLGCCYFVYSSKSSKQNHQKWRVIIPLELAANATEWQLLSSIVNDKFQAAGIEPDRASERHNQVAYLPNKGEFYQYFIAEDLPYLNWQKTLSAEIQAKKLAIEQQQIAKQRGIEERAKLKASSHVAQGLSPVKAFNDAYGLELMLDSYGYMKRGDRYLSPNSQSGVAGVSISPTGNKWHSLHESDYRIGQAASYGGYFGDAFDLFVFYTHGGDYTAALKAAGDMFRTADNITITKQNQRDYMSLQSLTAIDYDAFPDSEIQNNANEKIWNPDGDSIEKPVQNTLSFKLISHTVLMAKEFKSNWLIRGIIERGNLGLLFGNSAGGKSLLVQDMCFCIAAGLYFKGIETQQGKVVYICGEGFSGLQKRFKSLELHYGQTVTDLHYSECPAAFMDTHSAIAVSQAVDAIGDVNLVVVDTLHRNLGAGDENSAQDIGIFLNNIDTYLRPKGAAVLIIHHSGHDAKERSRGSSSIRAAMDVEFSVTKDDGGFVTLKNTKMKEWEPIQPLCFKFKTIELGLFDEYDFPMNGVVLESTNEVVNTKTKKLGDTAQKILTHLKTPFVGVKTPDDVRAFCSQKQYTIPEQVITLEDLRKAVYPLLNVEPNSKRTTLKRGIDELINRNNALFYNDNMWLIA